MKKLLTITVLMALAMSGFAQELHYDFAETVESGQTLYFLKGYYGPQDVMVTYPCYHDTIIYNSAGASTQITTYYYGHDEPSGDLVIPSTITHNDTVYTITTISRNAFWKCTNITSLTLPNTLNSIIQGAFAGCTGITGEVVIPNSVTHLGSDAFTNCTSLNSVVFSTALTKIGFSAFKRCTSLEHISSLPESLTRIYDCAFEGCSQLSGTIVIPPLITQIDEKVFNSCNITSVVIPEGVTKIKSLAFGGCPLDSIYIPSSVTSIKVDDGYGAGAFCGCTRLQSIIVDEANSVYDSRDNCNALIETATNTLLKGCKNTIIPNTVSIIWEGAFAGCLDLDSITIPNSVSYLGIGAFERCDSLSTITLPSSVSYISDCALACSGLTSITCKSSTPPTAFFESGYYYYSNSFGSEVSWVNREIPIYIPYGTTEAYQNASGWNYFTNFIEEAPILYTDFEPDLCVEELSPYDSHDTLKIDLDQDGTIDFKMYIKAHYSTQVRYVYVTSSWDFRYCYNSIYSYGYMDENDSIIPNHPLWAEANDTWELLWYPDQYMEFIMGFRKTVNDENYYAWARIYMYRNLNGNGYQPGPGEFDIVSAYCDDMAYCTIPDYPLRWGQTEIETPSPTPIVPDLYTIGYKDNNSATRTAKLYKNNALLHSIRVTGKQITPYKIANDSEGNIYWLVVYSANSSTLQTEIWKNDELYLSTEGNNGVTIKDLYCLGDTLFYVGNTTTEEGIKVATVWRGPDFTPHWVLGDGQHDSFIYDADVDKNTNIPYFCGYITDSLKKASVWKASQLLYKQEPLGSQRASWANEISMDNGSVFTNGYLNYDTGFGTVSNPTIWKDNVRILNGSEPEFINCLYASQDDFYYTLYYPHGMYYGVLMNNGDELLQLPFQSIQRIYGGFDDIYMVGKSDNKGSIWKNFELLSQRDDCDVIMDILTVEATDVDTTFTFDNTEWYYEILNDDGSITYQHLECVGDTLIGREGKRPKVIVRSNTHYDRNEITEVTHEYVYEENGMVYWWNKDLQEFTTLYNLNANAGDTWEIKVGTESLTMHVDAVENIEYEGQTYRMLHVSDSADVFSGNILCNIGHQTSFFPERLMTRDRGYRVEGIRCYWVNGELMYKTGNEDCDAIYAELHNGIEEDGPSTGSGTAGTLLVYPNPTTGVLFVETRRATSLPAETEYRITNLIGQTLLQGLITNETQQINIESLPAGMYFITLAGKTLKFVVK